MDTKILIVEDDLFIRDLYLHVFNNSGYTVLAAKDGEEGVTAANDKQPDIILLDIMLPKLNGIEALKRLKNEDKTRQIPVIMLTNLADDNVIKEAFQSGAQGYLIKTRYSPYEMVKQIEIFLQNPTKKLNG